MPRMHATFHRRFTWRGDEMCNAPVAAPRVGTAGESLTSSPNGTTITACLLTTKSARYLRASNPWQSGIGNSPENRLESPAKWPSTRPPESSDSTWPGPARPATTPLNESDRARDCCRLRDAPWSPDPRSRSGWGASAWTRSATRSCWFCLTTILPRSQSTRRTMKPFEWLSQRPDQRPEMNEARWESASSFRSAELGGSERGRSNRRMSPTRGRCDARARASEFPRAECTRPPGRVVRCSANVLAVQALRHEPAVLRGTIR